jgi:hypothetical protein
MRPTDFPEANNTFTIVGEGSESHLRVEYDGTQLLSCWTMTWGARLRALLYGRIWVCIQGQDHPPIWLSCERDPHVNDYERVPE